MTGIMVSSVEDRRAKKIAAEEKEIAELMEQAKKPDAPVEDPEVQDEPSSDPVVDDSTPPAEDPVVEPSGEEATWKKRYADLRRSSSKTKSELEARLKALEEAAPAPMAMPATDEELSDWQEKFPDIARIVETLASKKAAEKFGEAEAEIQTLKKEQEDTSLSRLEAAIRKEVPDYDDLVQDDTFLDWLDGEPDFVQNALYENTADAKKAIWVFNLYSERKEAPKKAKEKAKAAASSVPTKSTPEIDTAEDKGKILESWVDGLSMEDFEKHEKDILDAMKNDTFVYDLTGAAR